MQSNTEGLCVDCGHVHAGPAPEFCAAQREDFSVTVSSFWNRAPRRNYSADRGCNWFASISSDPATYYERTGRYHKSEAIRVYVFMDQLRHRIDSER